VLEHGAIGHPHVEMVRDILIFAQQRDPLKLTPAYPVNAASLGGRPNTCCMTHSYAPRAGLRPGSRNFSA